MNTMLLILWFPKIIEKVELLKLSRVWLDMKQNDSLLKHILLPVE